MDCSAAKSLTTGSFDKQLRLFDTRGSYLLFLLFLYIAGYYLRFNFHNLVAIFSWETNPA